jgi:hypothetical protein
MNTPSRGLWRARWLALLVLVAVAVWLPAAQAEDNGRGSTDGLLAKLSQGAAIGYLRAHPEQAPPEFAERLQAAEQLASRESAASLRASELGSIPAGVGVRFNRDYLGLPQNEESVTACGQGSVLGGTNDYRGLFDPKGNFTGWHLSTNGGQSVNNEGLLPPVREKGQSIESGGDPVAKAGPGCSLYMADLNTTRTSYPTASASTRATPRRSRTAREGPRPRAGRSRRPSP